MGNRNLQKRVYNCLRGGAMWNARLLAARCGTSQQAVRQAVAALRCSGCAVWDIPGFGWLLPKAAPPLNAAAIRQWLPAGAPWRIFTYTELDSTMDEAQRLAELGCEEYTVVFSESQRAGCGRLARPWYSPAGEGIWMTVLLRPKLPLEQATLFPLLAAVAVAEALHGLGFDVGIKWPNDILAADSAHWRRKLCGIRAEMAAGVSGMDWLSLGIGVNVNQQELPPELAGVAVSLRELNHGVPLLRARIAAAVLQQLVENYRRLQHEGFAGIRRTWLSYALCLGEYVTIQGAGTPQQGIATGIDMQGCLLLQEEGAALPQPVLAGDMVTQC